MTGFSEKFLSNLLCNIVQCSINCDNHTSFTCFATDNHLSRFFIIIQYLLAVTVGFFEGVVIFTLCKALKNNSINSGVTLSFILASVVFGGT